MKIQIFSDLHLDVHQIKPIAIMAGVDLVIVAGDTCEGVLRAFGHLRRIIPMHIPIVMVLGNHEFYRKFIPDELALARSHAAAFNIHVLENDTVVIGGVRFVGATLWTDYRVFGDANHAAAMNACASGMNDHRLIGWQKQPWLRLAVCHHAVHWESVHPRFRSDPATAAFVSDLSALIERYQPTLWVHGHVHNSSDYRVGGTRILCNPHGYANENPDFDGALVVEVSE
jgi:Icc-related predicted phosphoesterase